MADDDLRDDAALIARLRRLPVDTAAEHLAGLYRLKQAGAAAMGAARNAVGAVPLHERERPKPDAFDLGFDAVRFALDTWARWKRDIEAPQIAFVTRALAQSVAPAGGTTTARLVVDLGSVRPGEEQRGRFRVENPARAAQRVLLEPLTPRSVSGTAFTGGIDVVRTGATDAGDFVIPGEHAGVFEVVVKPAAGAAPAAYLASATVLVGTREAGTLTVAFRVVA